MYNLILCLDCKVGDWSDWGECKCPRNAGPQYSWQTEEPDTDPPIMNSVMKLKLESREKRRQCVESGKCPTYQIPKSVVTQCKLLVLPHLLLSLHWL